MKRACIAIVDGAMARLYSYELLDGEAPRLEEQKTLENAQARQKDEEAFSNTKPGSRFQEGGRGSTDDHRNAQRAQHSTLFAREIVDECARISKDLAIGHVILIASPKMLGALRQYEDQLTKVGIVIDEIQRDLTNLSGAQLHDHLASMNVIEPRERLGFARR